MQRKHERKTNRRRRRRRSNTGREKERENEPNALPGKTRREVHQLRTRLLRIFSSFNGVQEDQRPTQNSNSYVEHLQRCSVCDPTKIISHPSLVISFLSFFLPIGEREREREYYHPNTRAASTQTCLSNNQ
jgi:hypothetical protein